MLVDASGRATRVCEQVRQYRSTRLRHHGARQKISKEVQMRRGAAVWEGGKRWRGLDMG